MSKMQICKELVKDLPLLPNLSLGEQRFYEKNVVLFTKVKVLKFDSHLPLKAWWSLWGRWGCSSNCFLSLSGRTKQAVPSFLTTHLGSSRIKGCLVGRHQLEALLRWCLHEDISWQIHESTNQCVHGFYRTGLVFWPRSVQVPLGNPELSYKNAENTPADPLEKTPAGAFVKAPPLKESLHSDSLFGASITMYTKIWRFLPPPLLYDVAADLHCKIHATSLTSYAFP